MKKLACCLLLLLLAGCSIFRKSIDKHTEEDLARLEIETNRRDSIRMANLDLNDTIGSWKVFRDALAPELRQGIVRYVDSLRYHLNKKKGVINVKFVEKGKTDIWIYIGYDVNIAEGDDRWGDYKGYLLYDNAFLIRIISKKRSYFRPVIRAEKLKRTKYGIFSYSLAGNFDGVIFAYKILGPNSLKFMGEGFLDMNLKMHPMNW